MNTQLLQQGSRKYLNTSDQLSRIIPIKYQDLDPDDINAVLDKKIMCIYLMQNGIN